MYCCTLLILIVYCTVLYLFILWLCLPVPPHLSRARALQLSLFMPSVSMLADSGTTDGTIPLDTKDIPCHRSPIQSVLIAGNERSTMAAEALRALGFDVRAIRKPTVEEGTERLRITLHSYNTDAEVGDLRHLSLQSWDAIHLFSWFWRGSLTTTV